MRKAIKIGEKEFASKKEALSHYKAILNSYDFGETLKQNDFYDILDLLETHPNVIEKIGVGIDKVRVAKLNRKQIFQDLERLADKQSKRI